MGKARPFTQTDMKSVFKAAKDGGYSSARVEIILGDGNKMIATAAYGVALNDNEGSPENPWDEETQ